MSGIILGGWLLIGPAPVRAASLPVLGESGDPPTGMAANANEQKFRLLHTASKDNHDLWIRNIWGTVGFLVIALGWLLTAKGARIFLSSNKGARRVAIIGVIIMGMINVGRNIDLARRSAAIQKNLEKSEYVSQHELEPQHYGRYHVPYLNAVVSNLTVGSMFGLVLYLLISLGKWKEPKDKSRGSEALSG